MNIDKYIKSCEDLDRLATMLIISLACGIVFMIFLFMFLLNI